MENEVQNQTSPAPEGAPACSCGCKKKLIGAIVALVVIAAAVACLFFCNVFGQPALPKYAPEGTDVIAYVNGAKITQTKVWAAFKKTSAYKAMMENAKAEGVEFDEAKLGDVCFFFKVDEKIDGNAPTISMITRGKDGFAEEMFGKL